MNCPNCESSNCKTYKMVYLTLTSTSVSEGTNSGISVPIGGAPTINFGVNTGKALTQPLLASKVAPPKIEYEYQQGLYGVALIVGLLALFLSFGAEFPRWAVALICVPVSIALLYVVTKGFDLQEERYFREMRNWEGSWICMDCGHTW